MRRFAQAAVVVGPLCVQSLVGHSLAVLGIDSQTTRDRQVAALATLERVSTQPFGVPAPEIESACETLRSGGTPTAFEREWMIAAAGVLARSACLFPTDAARWHIDHALSRFPDDPQLQLDRVVMRPGQTALTRTSGAIARAKYSVIAFTAPLEAM